MEHVQIGDSVYYRSRGSADGEYPPRDCAAIVTAIHGDDFVDLAVFNPSGMFFNRNCSMGADPGQWHPRTTQ